MIKQTQSELLESVEVEHQLAEVTCEEMVYASVILFESFKIGDKLLSCGSDGNEIMLNAWVESLCVDYDYIDQRG